MRFLAITGTLFFTLVAAIFSAPLLSAFANPDINSASIEAAFSPSSIQEIVPSSDSSSDFSPIVRKGNSSIVPAIPVTDGATVVIPIIEAAEADVSSPAVEVSSEPSVDNVALEEAARADAEVAAALADLRSFIATVTNGYASLVTGVYVPDALALPIIQQPSGNAGHITMQAGAATQFGMASDFGTIGILAHNFLVGDQFFLLEEGMQVYIIHGDGSYDVYLITEIRRFQALQPNSPYSSFLDLDNNNAQLSGAQLFDQIYNQPGNVIFQTCIDANGLSTWGRIFISAEPISNS
ncbi:MAG: hypothetical protein IIC79_00395 [Chloroflexi bacterium]|nr:hypothetical protein [Chloroflexota bacterium]